MQRSKLSLLTHGFTAVLITLLAACSSAPVDKTAKMTPEELYADAKDESNNGQYEKAIGLLDKLEVRAAGTPLAQQAQLDKAYLYYKTAEPATALATLERYIKLYPASPAMDYALYLKGVINFNDDLGMFSSITRQDLSERDQKASKDSYQAFQELVNRFPNSRYAEDARQRMNYIVISLARYEIHVARYYYKRGAYLAAANRAQQAINDYRGVPVTEEALYILYKSYDALGMAELRDDAKRVLEENYPNSTFLANGLQEPKGPWWKLW
ncbi:outer membrane protein assembly factor BamD [Curvibacter sp. CHRR-16]|uniref:outer membrane protein assembly factor BamD n=1 Tax=Curvibacter sp. CHRR-16 TaxID=2835872 RepID=UPI001BDA1321|nr:outer membrane protein assembly factor BamD [Curvibacter sp. CHRR-16]MBT0570643.1 outer membrane protein assembly factor BamD [Curvibacter sp. CHRR-16]